MTSRPPPELTPSQLEAKRAAIREAHSHLTCNCCHRDKTEHPVIGVASSSMGPISFAFCEECLSKPAEPLGMFQYTMEMTEGNVADWVKNMFTFRFGEYISWDQFAALPFEEQKQI